MRISIPQRDLLVNSIASIRPDAKIYLFGSRADDDKKGGDIDILILDERRLEISEAARVEKIFWQTYGEQKLDLVCFPPNSEEPFKKLIMLHAIPLN